MSGFLRSFVNNFLRSYVGAVLSTLFCCALFCLVNRRYRPDRLNHVSLWSVHVCVAGTDVVSPSKTRVCVAGRDFIKLCGVTCYTCRWISKTAVERKVNPRISVRPTFERNCLRRDCSPSDRSLYSVLPVPTWKFRVSNDTTIIITKLVKLRTD